MADNDKNLPSSSKTSATANEDASSSSKPPPRVIGNFTTQADASRIGPTATTRMKFTPNMPIKKKQPEDTSAKSAVPARSTAPTSSSTHTGTSAGRGKGAVRGRGRGAGRGDGSKTRGGQPEMIPAGPFAMGPLAAGMAGSSRATTNIYSSHGGGAGGVRTGVRPSGAGAGVKGEGGTALPQNRDALVMDDEAREVYSDDEGMVIVDLEDVKALDYMAPDALKRERRKEKGKGKVKKEKETGIKQDPEEVGGPAREAKSSSPAKNESQALDLSESEEEIELEDLQQHFQVVEDDEGFHQDQFYFFQFPDNFPIFEPVSVPTADTETDIVDVDAEAGNKASKKVSFAQDVKAGTSATTSGATTPRVTQRIEGLIGNLEIHQSGAVRMRMPNGIVFDVFAGTQPSFLQQAVAVDLENKRMNVLGSVTQRFVCTPDIDALTSSKQEAMDLDPS